jgi:HEAT repeat protein
VQDVVFYAGATVLAVSFVAWALLGIVVVVGRTRFDRRRGESSRPLGSREARRLVARALRPVGTERGTWRRIAAFSRLARAHHPAAPRVVRQALSDRDERVSAAAVRALGEIGDEWAVELLVDALREGRVPRSRVASQLEHVYPLPAPQLVPLLRDRDPAVRFWAATLLAPYPELGESQLVLMTHDRDANVRAAAAETLGTRGGQASCTAILALLDDPAWFVRVHAARSAGQLLEAAATSSLVRLLCDARWWVRTAAKDALRGIGPDAVPALLAMLTDPDAFARNGAAEVLQDIGFVDSLLGDRSRSALLERIFEAGGEQMRRAAEERARRARRLEEVQAA